MTDGGAPGWPAGPSRSLPAVSGAAPGSSTLPAGYVPGHTVLPPSESAVAPAREPARPFGQDFRDFVLRRLRWPFLISMTVFLVAAVGATAWSHANPDSAAGIIGQFLDAKGGTIAPEGKITAIGLFRNNARAGALLVALGFIAPLAIGALAVNGAMIGVAAGLAESGAGVAAWKVIVFGVLPHGIVELPALFFAGAIGLYAGTYWMRRRKPYSWGRMFALSGLAFLVLVVGFDAVAAVIEAHVTPLAMKAAGIS